MWAQYCNRYNRSVTTKFISKLSYNNYHILLKKPPAVFVWLFQDEEVFGGGAWSGGGS